MFNGIICCTDMNYDEMREIDGRLLIQRSLDLCKKYNLTPVIVSLPKKDKLNSFAKEQGIRYEITDQLYTPSYPWLDKKGILNVYNILIFPDVKLENEDIIEDVKKTLTIGKTIVIVVASGPTRRKFRFVDYGQIFYATENSIKDCVYLTGYIKRPPGDLKYFDTRDCFPLDRINVLPTTIKGIER